MSCNVLALSSLDSVLSFMRMSVVTATSSIVLKGFSSPADFTQSHKEAFKLTLVQSSSKIRYN